MSAEPDRPSGRAVERLATGVGGEVSGLRNQLRRALDEADRLQGAGREDLAVRVLEEQRDALVAVHRQLESRLADAVVEREAEGVLAGAATRSPLLEDGPEPLEPAGARGQGTADQVPGHAGVDLDEEHLGLRLVAATAAAVLGVVLLLTPEVGPGALSAAGSSTASDADAPGDAPRAVDDGTTPAVARPVAASEGDVGEPVHVRDVWALVLRRGGVAATPDDGRGGDDETDVTDVLDRLPLPTAEAPLGPVTTDPTGIVVDHDATNDDSGTAGSGTDGGGSTDDDAASGSGDGTTGTGADGTDGAEAPEGERQGDAATDDGTDGTDATGPSGGATTTDGETDSDAGGEAPDDGGSVDLESGEVTPGLER